MDDGFFLQPIKRNRTPNEFEKDGSDSGKDTLSTQNGLSNFKTFLGKSGDGSIEASEKSRDVSLNETKSFKSQKPIIQNGGARKKCKKGRQEHDVDLALESGEKICKILKFFVKKGRVFEIRKLTRRIQLLCKKKGSEREMEKNKRKVAKILETVEELKHISIDFICGKFSKILQELFEKIKWNKDEPSVQLNWLEMLGNSFSSEDGEGLLHCLRLLNSKSIVAKFNEEIQQYFEVYIVGSQISEKGEHLQLEAKQQLTEMKPNKSVPGKGTSSFKRKSRRNRDRKESEEGTHVQISQNGTTDTTKRKGEAPYESSKVMKDALPGKFKNSNTKKRTKDCKIESKEVKLKNFKAQLRKFKNMNGNRLGQRARRELWEKMYGNDAVHVKKGIKSRQKFKVIKHRAGQMSNKKQTIHNKTIQEHRKTTETNMHPSWEAKRNQKLQNQIVKFEGSKIKFDD